MDSGSELIAALSQVAREKGIDKELIFEAIEASLVSASKKHFGPNANLRVSVNRETGLYDVFAQKNVVESVTDNHAEITLEEAREINGACEIGDTVEMQVKPGNFGRIAAQTAKQVVVQKFREAEREILYNEFINKECEIVTGVVQRRDRKSVIISLGRLEAVLLPSEQIPRESYEFQDRVKVYILNVTQSSKGPIVNVSRSHPELVKRLFEQEVPEVYDGVVEIKSIAREPGNRTKIAVYSKNPNVDPVGSCVGQNGYRVNIISSELCGEKIDIIQWNSDSIKYIAAALSPSKVIDVAVNPSEMAARVIVPDHQLSLAIGKEGQNARLAAKLTGWRIDIKSESQAEGTDFFTFPEKVEAAEEEYDDEYYDDDYYDEDEYDDDYYDDEDEYDDDYYDDEDEYDDEYYDEDEYEEGYEEGAVLNGQAEGINEPKEASETEGAADA
ncbi:MAG: transcription termination factor NusA [Defluviitaleaceae bacterium]|nr:transcription termination factor NusA [Defluviitaleaceae bacterium]